MPHVRLAATGMDSCPASDEDTEDELESARRNSNATRTRLLPSTSRQLVRNRKQYCYQILLNSQIKLSVSASKVQYPVAPSFLAKCIVQKSFALCNLCVCWYRLERVIVPVSGLA